MVKAIPHSITDSAVKGIQCPLMTYLIFFTFSFQQYSNCDNDKFDGMTTSVSMKKYFVVYVEQARNSPPIKQLLQL